MAFHFGYTIDQILDMTPKEINTMLRYHNNHTVQERAFQMRLRGEKESHVREFIRHNTFVEKEGIGKPVWFDNWAEKHK